MIRKPTKKSKRWRQAIKEFRVIKANLPLDVKDAIFGDIDWECERIRVSKFLPPLEQMKTLLHECLHWEYPDADEIVIAKLEEEIWAEIDPISIRILLDALYPKKDIYEKVYKILSKS